MKNYETRTPYTLEAELGITPIHRLNMCKSLITDNGACGRKTYYLECKECKKLMYSRIRKKVLSVVWVIISVFILLVLSTPQGAIRRNLLVTKGINVAASAIVCKKEIIKQGAFHIDIYTVCIDGIEEMWKVKYISSNCYATKIELDH